MDAKAWASVVAVALTVLGLLGRWAWKSIIAEIRSVKTYKDVDELRAAVSRLNDRVGEVLTSQVHISGRMRNLQVRISGEVANLTKHVEDMNRIVSEYVEAVGKMDENNRKEQSHLQHRIDRIFEDGCGHCPTQGNGDGRKAVAR